MKQTFKRKTFGKQTILNEFTGLSAHCGNKIDLSPLSTV
jgi:hypothetical protein